MRSMSEANPTVPNTFARLEQGNRARSQMINAQLHNKEKVSGSINLTVTGPELEKLLGLLTRGGFQINFIQPDSPHQEPSEDVTETPFGEPQVSPQKEKDKSLLTKAKKDFVRVVAAATLVSQALPGLAHAEDQKSDVPPPVPGVQETLPANFPTSQKAYEVFFGTEAANTPNAYGPEVSREFLEAHPVGIRATSYVTDAQGNVTKEYVVLQNGSLYNSQFDSVSKTFSMFSEVSKAPMENPSSLISSNDGNTLLMGGESPIRSGITKVYISNDAGKTWKNIPWPYQDSGGTIDLLKFTENNLLGNNGNYEGGVGQFVVQIDTSAKTASIKAANFETIRATNFNAGSAHDIHIASINPATNKAEMISDGSLNLQQGILLFKDFDYVQGTGTVENITHVTINGVDTELGFLRGGAQYTDAQGHVHYKTSDRTLQLLYDIDLTTRTATRQSVGGLLDNTGVANYADGNLRLSGLDINGNYTWAVGDYG